MVEIIGHSAASQLHTDREAETTVVDFWAEVRRLEQLAAEAKAKPGSFVTVEGEPRFNYDTEAGIAAAQADLDSYAFKKSHWETNITMEGGPCSLPWGLLIGRRQMDINEARKRLKATTANAVGTEKPSSASQCTHQSKTRSPYNG